MEHSDLKVGKWLEDLEGESNDGRYFKIDAIGNSVIGLVDMAGRISHDSVISALTDYKLWEPRKGDTVRAVSRNNIKFSEPEIILIGAIFEGLFWEAEMVEATGLQREIVRGFCIQDLEPYIQREKVPEFKGKNLIVRSTPSKSKNLIFAQISAAIDRIVTGVCKADGDGAIKLPDVDSFSDSVMITPISEAEYEERKNDPPEITFTKTGEAINKELAEEICSKIRSKKVDHVIFDEYADLRQEVKDEIKDVFQQKQNTKHQDAPNGHGYWMDEMMERGRLKPNGRK